MSRHGRRSPRKKHGGEPSFHFRPFRTLPRPATASLRGPAPPSSTPAPLPPDETDEDLFRREMAGVVPLAAEARARVPGSPGPFVPKEVTSPEAEALAQLSELVAGHGHFDITDTTEYIEGRVIGLDPHLVRQLRKGAFAYQNHLDLHGMRLEEARTAVECFFRTAYRDGLRCVLVVHGRGRNSDGGVPVLKNWLIGWLSRGPGARIVLAFTSARPCDGGAGALYVLLRRRRHRKQPIAVMEGAKV